jgi:cytochrome b6-f complex iron-sulfur subunit
MSEKKEHNAKAQTRRMFIRKIFLWSSTLASVLLLYPLQKFLRFKVKPKPRYIKVQGPLPRGMYHTGPGFILFDNGKTSLAVSRTCTHLGCTIQYLEDKQYIECPCHQSRFSRQGKRLTGPAERNLTVYNVEVKRDQAGAPAEYIVELT